MLRSWADSQIDKLGWSHGPEQTFVNDQIDEALANNLSKQGGERPDHTVMITNLDETIPVFVEYKGSKNKLVKLDKQELVVLRGKWEI